MKYSEGLAEGNRSLANPVFMRNHVSVRLMHIGGGFFPEC